MTDTYNDPSNSSATPDPQDDAQMPSSSISDSYDDSADVITTDPDAIADSVANDSLELEDEDGELTDMTDGEEIPFSSLEDDLDPDENNDVEHLRHPGVDSDDE